MGSRVDKCLCLDCNNRIPKTSGLKQQISISHSSGDWNSKIKIPAELVSGWIADGCHLTACSNDFFFLCVCVEWERERDKESKLCGVYSHKDANAIGWEPILTTSFNFSNFHRSPICKYSHTVLGVEFQHLDWFHHFSLEQREANIQYIPTV